MKGWYFEPQLNGKCLFSLVTEEVHKSREAVWYLSTYIKFDPAQLYFISIEFNIVFPEVKILFIFGLEMLVIYSDVLTIRGRFTKSYEIVKQCYKLLLKPQVCIWHQMPFKNIFTFKYFTLSSVFNQMSSFISYLVVWIFSATSIEKWKNLLLAFLKMGRHFYAI